MATDDFEIKLALFKRDRREALLSLDKATIMAFMRKYGEPAQASSEEVFWAGVHKARTALPELPLQDRLVSKAWLDAHNYQSADDGELDSAKSRNV
jgi:hypothetical protein